MIKLQAKLRHFEETIVSNLDRILGFPREKNRFLRAHGYPLNLKTPKSFNEKICYKKIFDRNPLLKITADKFRVKEYLGSTLGTELAEEISIPLITVFSSADEFSIEGLPDEYVLKSNHGSGNNILVTKKDQPNQRSLKKTIRRWFSEPYGARNHEWAYIDIPRKVLVEQMLKDDSGNIPADYKFHMINGECALIKLDNDRHNDFTSTLYDQNWNKLPVSWRRRIGKSQPRPQEFAKMLKIAEKLSKPFDFVRVDFYTIGEKVYFSELTHYPSRGRGKFDPTDFDFELGKRWTINY